MVWVKHEVRVGKNAQGAKCLMNVCQNNAGMLMEMRKLFHPV